MLVRIILDISFEMIRKFNLFEQKWWYQTLPAHSS